MEQGAYGNILGLLRARSGVDFTIYTQGILRRQIKRHMTSLRLESPEDYERYLRNHPPEIQSLLNDILVLIGGFFRIPAALKWFRKSHTPAEPADKLDDSESETEINNRKDLETAKHRSRPKVREPLGMNDLTEAAKVSHKGHDPVPGLFKALVDSSDDAIIMKDLDGIIRTWNKGAERIFGYTADEIIGKPVTDLMPPALRPEEPGILGRIRDGERVEHYDTVRVTKDGRLVDISLTISPIINDKGQIIGASKIARDITERKRWEAEIKRAHDEAEQANHAKDEFMATLSHELRTPLNPVLLLAGESAADHELPKNVRTNFETIRDNIELEARLIDDLLDLTRLRTGKLKIEKTDVSIHDVLFDTISIVRKEIDQKKINLRQNLADPESIVFGDPVRLRQIFWNILKNAVKFTPRRGTITVESHVEQGKYVATVSDTGIGMTQNELAHAFEAFKQGRHSRDSGRFGGLGLGLAITRRFVELHSGSIIASSPGPDRGSSFTIQFPLAAWNRIGVALDLPPLQTNASGEQGKFEPGKTQNYAKILLVEDHEPTRSTLALILKRRHLNVFSAASVGEAIAIAENQHFDLVISDIGLPDGNGYDLFRRIHEQSPIVKGIALSGYGMEQDLARSRSTGFQTHLIKPVKIEALDRALKETLAAEVR